jgi:phospholipid/cholesterol/gamma-HCH transport system substrate-binding protein
MRPELRHVLQFGGFTVGLTGLAVLLASNMNASGLPWAGRYQVKAEFTDADLLLKDQDVRISGIQAGKVSDVAPTGDGHVIVSMVIDRRYAPIHTDGSARVRPFTLIGDKYVDIDPGSSAAPGLPDGATIPVGRTSVPVELEQVLALLDADTRTQVDHLLTQGGAALAGRGETVSRLLQRLPELERSLTATLLVADSRVQTIDHLLGSADTLLTSLAQRQARIRAAVDSAAGLLGALAGDRDMITQTVTSADRSLTALARALAGEGADGRALVAGAPALLDELQRFLRLADADVTGVAPETPQLRTLLAQLRSGFSARDSVGGYYVRALARDDCATTVAGPLPPCSLPSGH